MNASTTHAGAEPAADLRAETRVSPEARDLSPADEDQGGWGLGIARDAGDRPVFSLTLVLDRVPGPDEEHIGDFIEQAVLSFDATLRRQTPAATSGGSPFAREAHLRLSFAQPAADSAPEASATTVLATACGSGLAVRANLHARLERAATLDVLAAIRGEPGGLTVSADVTTRVEREARSLTLRGSWAAVHDFLAPRVDRGFGFHLPNLRRVFCQMLHEPALEVSVAGGDGTDWLTCEEEEALFRAFLRMSPVVLEHATPGLPEGDTGHRWLLKDRPAEGFELTHTEHRPTTATETERTEAPLHEILAPALDGLERDRFIRLVAPARDGSGGYEPVARRQRSPRRRSGRRVEGPSAPGPAAVVNGRAVEIGRMLQPGAARTVAPRVLAATDLAASVVTAGRTSHYLISDGVAALTAGTRARPLPVVDDAAKPLWRDRVRADRYWYAQEFQLVRPSPDTPWAESPFLFAYARIGATASGEPALRGQVLFHLRKVTPQAVTDELARRERTGADPVAMRDVSVTLGVPFVDERDGRTKTHPLVGTVEDLGDDELRVTVDVAGDWLRLCYGALAQPGFQSRPATVQVSWAFEGYTPVKKDKLTYTIAHLSATTPVVYTATAGGSRPKTHFDASSLTYHSAGGEMRLVRESSGRGRRPAAMMLARPIKPASLVIRPEVRPLPVADPPAEETYFLQTHLRQQSLDALFPCDELGSFYREETSGGSEAIGCRDALRLGEIAFRQYQEIPELAHTRYRVHRSLAQPSRFLVVPQWYRITRYAAEEDRAWRPVIMLHSSYDEKAASGGRFLFHATLEPAIPPWERRVLLAKLAAYAETPILEYPTDIESDASFTWTIASGLAEEVVTQTVPHAIVVSLSTDEMGALQLKGVLETTGVVGSARFTLPDGHWVASSLGLQLTQITGTWEHGPLELRRVDGEVILTNRVERRVVVADLVTWPGPPEGARVPVETELAPGSSHTVTLADQPAEVHVDYSIPAADPVALEEMRTFVEDLHTNVVFVELVNYANHDLAHLEIRARLRGLGDERSVPMTGDPRVGELSFTLPLTSYLQEHTLEFQVTRVQVSGESSRTEWIEWDLETHGNVISITWDLIA